MKSSVYFYYTLLIVALLIIDVAARKKSKGSSKNNIEENDSMICPPCEKLFCTVKKASKLKCRGGVTTDICGCCPVCAKQAGEPCGGEWNYLGKCDQGLYCKPISSFSSYHLPRNAEVPMNGIPEGICMQGWEDTQDKKTPFLAISPGKPDESVCKPKCTPDYCTKNPRAICSAIDVVDMKKDCQGQCQHTSCYACSWVNPEPECPSCAADDFRCIKKFAKCIKRDYCTRQKFPCKTELPDSAMMGKFQCQVPKCPGKS